MIASSFWHPGKPLATKGPSKLGPICFVDASSATSGPRLHEAERLDIEPVRKIEPKSKEEQASEAARQWSRSEYAGDGTSTSKPWIKSWYYPVDAFDPWPTKTDLCCWWCTCQFDWSPFPLPYSYDMISSRYRAVGIFCGPSCAKAYARNDSRYDTMPNIGYFIEKIATTFYGYKLHVKTGASKMCTIPEAPSKEILQKFCGPNGFTIEQYRAMCCCGRSLKMLPPNIITMKQVIEAQQEMAKTKSVYHPENPDDIQRISDLVKQKRIPYVGPGAKRMSDYIKTRS